MYKYSILYSRPGQPQGLLEQTDGVVKAISFQSALMRVLEYYNNYIITSITLVAIDDIIDVLDIKEI